MRLRACGVSVTERDFDREDEEWDESVRGFTLAAIPFASRTIVNARKNARRSDQNFTFTNPIPGGDTAQTAQPYSIMKQYVRQMLHGRQIFGATVR